MDAVGASFPRGRGCANPCCNYAVHSDPLVCERFCCKRCEGCFYTRPASESIYHGRYCEHVPALPDVPRAPAAPSFRALEELHPWPRDKEESTSELTTPMSEVFDASEGDTQRGSYTPILLQPWRRVPSPAPGTTSVALRRLALRRLAKGRSMYIMVRTCENGWTWLYCTLCQQWADTGHLLSRKHTHRMQWPEWYMRNAENDGSSTTFDTDSLGESSITTVAHRGTLGLDLWSGYTGSWCHFRNSAIRAPSSSAPTPPPPPSPLPRRSPLPPPSDLPSLRLPDTGGKVAMSATDADSVYGSSIEMASRVEQLFSAREWDILGNLQDFLRSEAGSCKSEP